jgi:hypothetical protein
MTAARLLKVHAFKIKLVCQKCVEVSPRTAYCSQKSMYVFVGQLLMSDNIANNDTLSGKITFDHLANECLKQVSK